MDLQELSQLFMRPDSDKLWIILQIEQSAEKKATKLLLDVACDVTEDEVVRIEALKAIRNRKIDDDEREQNAQTIVAVLKGDESELVQSYAALALRDLLALALVRTTLEAVVADSSYDEDVRFNALDSIFANSDVKECREALARLRLSSDFGDTIDRWLTDKPR